MIDGYEIIEATATQKRGDGFSGGCTATEREHRHAARFALRFLENCPEDATVMDIRHAIEDAFPSLMSGGGV